MDGWIDFTSKTIRKPLPRSSYFELTDKRLTGTALSGSSTLLHGWTISRGLEWELLGALNPPLPAASTLTQRPVLCSLLDLCMSLSKPQHLSQHSTVYTDDICPHLHEEWEETHREPSPGPQVPTQPPPRGSLSPRNYWVLLPSSSSSDSDF